MSTLTLAQLHQVRRDYERDGYVVIRVIAASTRIADPNWPGVFHLRGQRREDVNRYLPEPA